MREDVGVLYEFKTVDVFSPPAPGSELACGVAPYYLQRALPQLLAPQPAAFEDAVVQQAAQGWEFCQIEEISVRQRPEYLDLMLTTSETMGVHYSLSFRRAKHM